MLGIKGGYVAFKRLVFKRQRNENIFPSNLTLAESEFYRVGLATEKAQVPTFVFHPRNVKRVTID